MKKITVCFAWLLFLSVPARGELFNLPALSTSQTDPVFSTLASSFFFRPVEPARGYGHLWGVGLGVAVNGTSTAAVSSIITGLSSFIPNADINLGLTVPLGLTVEVGFLPSLTYQGTSFSKVAGGVKWNLNQVVLTDLPFDLAVRAGYTSGSLLYTQNTGGPTVNVNYSSGVFTTNLIVSKNFVLVEPFAGLGVACQSSTLTGTGSGTIFGAGFPASTTTYSASSLSVWAHAGVLLNLQLVRISGSIDYAFGLASFSGKLAFSL